MSNVKGIKDVKDEDEDDKKRQAYYAGGQGQNGGGRRARTSRLHAAAGMPCLTAVRLRVHRQRARGSRSARVHEARPR